MSLLEGSLRQLTGRRFKLFLRRQSARKVPAIAGAAIVTGVLQSSSIVNLMVLALAGTGVIHMQNALALMLGANLGTTLDTWFVATVGFKLNMEYYALPVIGIASIIRALIRTDSTAYSWTNFLLGLGFLFLGLDFMKVGMTALVRNVDLGEFSDYPAIIFMLIGVVFTALIQSSSAMIAIVLSALYADAITLHSAMAVTLGAEVGTTLKLLLASAGGSPVKKRVAVGNVFYNCAIALLFLIFLSPVRYFITNYIGIRDQLIALSFFQTFVNLVGIVLFFPLLRMLGKFLERLFDHDNGYARYLKDIPVSAPDIAIDAIQKEAGYLLACIIYYSRCVFDIDHATDTRLSKKFIEMTLPLQYDYIKHLHGDIYAYSIRLQHISISKKEAIELNQLLDGIRSAMYAAKNIKDVYYDIDQLKNSGNDTKYNFYLDTRQKASDFYQYLSKALQNGNSILFEELVNIYKVIQNNYSVGLNELYKEDRMRTLNEVEISTIINFNREIFTSFKSLVLGIKDCLLPPKDAAYFDDLPGFIH